MNRNKITALSALATIGAGLLSATMLAGPAAAETVVVSSPQAAPTAPATPGPAVRTTVVGIDLAPATIKVSGHDGKKVTVATAGQKARTITPKSKTTPAVFTKLTPGKAYTVSVDGKTVAKTTVLAAPGQTYNMVVKTTNDPGSVLMTWDYTAAPKSGDVHFVLSATPVVGQADTTVVQLQAPIDAREAVLSGLNPNTLYKFSVEAVNDAASGKGVDAVMTRTLGDLTGADAAATAAAEDAARKAAEDAARKVAEDAAAQQQAARPSSGGGSSAPAMRTIWECPTGFSDNGTDCITTRAYTFHTETETQAYTYSTVQTGTRRNTDNEHCDYLPDGNGGLNIYCTGGYDEPVYSTVKNGTPAGFTDNGSAWVRDVQVKDAAPAGFSDNGSAYVKTTAKVSREVPA